MCVWVLDTRSTICTNIYRAKWCRAKCSLRIWECLHLMRCTVNFSINCYLSTQSFQFQIFVRFTFRHSIYIWQQWSHGLTYTRDIRKWLRMVKNLFRHYIKCTSTPSVALCECECVWESERNQYFVFQTLSDRSVCSWNDKQVTRVALIRRGTKYAKNGYLPPRQNYKGPLHTQTLEFTSIQRIQYNIVVWNNWNA